jgi:hypothetical protein
VEEKRERGRKYSRDEKCKRGGRGGGKAVETRGGREEGEGEVAQQRRGMKLREEEEEEEVQ